MRIEAVSDVDDPRIAIYRDLARSNLTRSPGLFIAEGGLLVDRLLASSYEIASVLLDERFVDEFGPRLADAVPAYVVPHHLVSEVVGFRFHRGVLACGRRRPAPQIGELLPSAAENLTAVVAVDVGDPENMGAILRTSAAFGVDLVLASDRCADPFSRRVLRTSMGAVFKLPLRTTCNLMHDLELLRKNWRVELTAAVLDADAEPLKMARRAARFGLLVGNEGHGLPPELVARCDCRVTIPMASGVDSLNVAVATGIVLYHFLQAES